MKYLVLLGLLYSCDRSPLEREFKVGDCLLYYGKEAEERKESWEKSNNPLIIKILAVGQRKYLFKYLAYNYTNPSSMSKNLFKYEDKVNCPKGE